MAEELVIPGPLDPIRLVCGNDSLDSFCRLMMSTMFGLDGRRSFCNSCETRALYTTSVPVLIPFTIDIGSVDKGLTSFYSWTWGS